MEADQKKLDEWNVRPNLLDYATTCASFSWESILREIDGLPDDKGINIAHEAVVRHAMGRRGNHLAIRWLGRNGTVLDYSYHDLHFLSNQFANVLKQLSVDKGDRVFVLTGRIPELYISALGVLKNVSVFCPLFSAFGPEPIRQRLSKGDGRVLVTTQKLYKQKVADLREQLP